ncbi:MAG: S41 family peptidase [Gammaproteobacteria bacterium]|nr:S41 family peptidase [Gammaproteobacteria bacterium]
MSLKFRSILVLLVGTALGLSLSLGSGVLAERETGNSESLPWDEARLLAEVLERVKQEYVEPVNDRQLIEAAVRGMVMDLDPHSQFLDTDEYEEIRINTTGTYSGVGLEVNVVDGQVVVVSPIEGMPADVAGIRARDIIVAIDDDSVIDFSLTDTITKMRGKPGTRVAIRIERAGEPEPIDFNVIRSHVQVRSVRSELLERDYGYIRLTHFSETTYKDLRKAIDELQRNSPSGLQGLVLDLRNNPGGVLDAAVEVTDAFLDEGLIVTASGRGRESNFERLARPGDLLDGAELVVMVNEGSASASEIVAGALQDHGRATVVGHRTFGKGSVQTVMPLSNGRAIKLTTSRYYTPSGDSIHGQGITPDLLLDDTSMADALAAVTEHRTEAGAALLQTDGQLRQALQVLTSGRVMHSKAD